MPPQDPNDDEDEEDEEDGGDADDDREPAVIREPDRRWLHRQALIRVFVLPHRPALSPSGMRKLRANPAPKGLDFLRRLSVAGVLGDAEAGRDRIRKIDARGQLRRGEHTKAH